MNSTSAIIKQLQCVEEEENYTQRNLLEIRQRKQTKIRFPSTGRSEWEGNKINAWNDSYYGKAWKIIPSAPSVPKTRKKYHSKPKQTARSYNSPIRQPDPHEDSQDSFYPAVIRMGQPLNHLKKKSTLQKIKALFSDE